ncbi:MAG: F0F1 ATP synthase subunit epsilon [Bacteroidales bacterium]|nr:F0F1 ATP synthase subunit epsilon [Bacteroidales bacterium]
MKVTVYTPEWSRSFDAEAVFLPGSAAPFEVLPGHAPLISTLEAGQVRWRSGGKEETLAVKTGAVRVAADNIEICAEV